MVVLPTDGKEATISYIYLGFFETEVIFVLITCSKHNFAHSILGLWTYV
jgi:hypothetical protein